MVEDLKDGPLLSIAAVERDTGLTKDTLRVWERRYGFPTPGRDAFGERTYPLEQVERLRLIKRLLDAGWRPGRLMKLAPSEVASLADGLPGQAQVVAASPGGEPLQACEVVRRIHDAGGLAVLAHPSRYRLSFQRLIPAAAALGFDGAEAYYDYDLQPRWQPTPVVCDAIARLLDDHALLRSCGTDTHGLELRGR